MERKFEGVWFPKELWFSKDLKAIEKMMAIEINSLDKTENHCFAQDSHFVELLGVSQATITRVMKSLEDKNVIKISTKTTQNGKKRTIKSNLQQWLLEKSSQSSKRGLRNPQNEESYNSISYNKDTKVSTAEMYSADVIETEFSFGEEKKDPTKDFPPRIKWIYRTAVAAKERSAAEGASQPFTIPRDMKAKYLLSMHYIMNDISNGKFIENRKFEDNFLKHLDQDSVEALESLKGSYDSVIHKAIESSIDKYLTARNNEEYDFIARDRKIDLATFMYEYNEKNGVLGVSHFLKYLDVELEKRSAAAGPERMLEVIYKKDLQKMYGSLYNNYRDFDDTEMARMIKSVLSLCRWWNHNVEKLSEVYRGSFKIRFPDGMYSFIEYYLAGYLSECKYQHPILLIPGKKYWKAFGDYIFEHTDIDLDCEMKKTVKESSGMTITEIQKRMEEE